MGARASICVYTYVCANKRMSEFDMREGGERWQVADEIKEKSNYRSRGSLCNAERSPRARFI